MSERHSGTPRLPDFVIIGAAKAGTTTLHDHLARHPRVAMAMSSDPTVRDKEPGYFDEYYHWDRGLDWYRTLWMHARPDQLCGEASTNYTRHPQVPLVPERMKEVVPDARLIYMMRHPVERAYSHYVHRWTKELHPGEPFTVPFEAFVERDPMCLDSSDYALQLRRFLEQYPKSAILALRTDDLEHRPAEVLDRLLTFLGLDRGVDLLADSPRVRNPGGVSEKVLRKHLMGPLRSNPLGRRLQLALPKSWRDRIWSMVRASPVGRRMRESFSPPPMRPETREVLLERYRESNRWLQEEFGIDTSPWER